MNTVFLTTFSTKACHDIILECNVTYQKEIVLALKPTIYKYHISLSNLNTDQYEVYNLTLAQHPSETAERMMARVLAFCLNADDALLFTKGLSSVEEPDIWAHSLDGTLLSWIDVGEPASDRIKKASRIAKAVKVYCFNRKSDTWWNQNQEKFKSFSATVTRFNWEGIQALAKLLERTMDMSVSISGDSIYLAAGQGECEVIFEELQ